MVPRVLYTRLKEFSLRRVFVFPPHTPAHFSHSLTTLFGRNEHGDLSRGESAGRGGLPHPGHAGDLRLQRGGDGPPHRHHPRPVPDLRGRPGRPALHLHPQVRPSLRHRHHGPAGGPQRPPDELHRHPEGPGSADRQGAGHRDQQPGPLLPQQAGGALLRHLRLRRGPAAPAHPLHHPLRPGVRYRPLRPAEGPGGGAHGGSQRGGQHPLQLLHPPRHDRRGREALRVLRGGHLR